MPGQYFQPTPARPIAKGLNDTANPTLLQDGESPFCRDVDFDRDTVAASGGAVKFNNQTAPRPGLLVGIPNKQPLPVLPAKSAPSRGAVFIPYSQDQDIGGKTAAIAFGAGPHNKYFHTQRGRSFDLQISFQVPNEEKLFKAPTLGQLTNIPSGGTWNTRFGADQALDEFFTIVQKGGEGLTPMSWCLGVVNTGDLFDRIATPGSPNLNIFGVDVLTYEKRASNYALCFMWLDLARFGQKRPVLMRYRITDGSIYSNETTEVAATFGAYSTLAYRAFIVPFFVEPGDSNHVAIRLTLDSGTPGSGAEPGVGGNAAVDWNSDGSLEIKVARNFDAVQTFSFTDAATSGVFRYKGPTDSLQYLLRYGIRYFGRDGLWLGRGFACAPWASAGFVPYGIDSAPVENGGFQISDHSVMGPIGQSVYAEYQNPEAEPNPSTNNPSLLYNLRVAHNTDGATGDPTGLKFEISQRGLVHEATAPGHIWGNETLQWDLVGVQGKLPWSPHDQAWSGLGGRIGEGNGFNPEALRSYRLVAIADVSGAGEGFSNQQAAGALFSIASYTDGAPYAASVYPQYLTMEGVDQFLNANPDFGPTGSAQYTLQGTWLVAIRAFRWNQRRIVVSDFRIYSCPRTWSEIADFSLTHELDREAKNDPGLKHLVLWMPCTDGGGALAREYVRGNHGRMTPLSVPTEDGLFLCGEGEALFQDLGENPDFKSQLLAALGDGQSGCAIEIEMLLPQAYYGISQRVNDAGGTGGSSSLYKHKFCPPLAVWDFEDQDRASDLGLTYVVGKLDHIGGHTARPPPLLEFGHNVEVEFAVGIEAQLYPAGFSLKVPTNFIDDNRAVTAAVPGTGATGMHAWYYDGANNQTRWDPDAGWVGRPIVIQVGLEPTGTAETYKAYIAAWPKEFLRPNLSDALNAEFGYWTQLVVTKRDIERSTLVIGGAWNPKLEERYDATLQSWEATGRAYMEASARVILRRARVYAATPSGKLPASTGGLALLAQGKIIGENALPRRDLVRDDVARQLSKAGSLVNVTRGSRTVTAAGGIRFSIAPAAEHLDGILRTFIEIEGEDEIVPTEDSLGLAWRKSYFVIGVTATTLTLSRPYDGPTRTAVPARMFRLAATTDFTESTRDPPLAVGRGKAYNPSIATTRDARITPGYFKNLSPIGIDWRFRIFSNIPAGNPKAFQPRWARGLKRSFKNPILRLHSQGQVLLAGSQGSLFLVDDRWRLDGPSATLDRSIEFFAERDPSTNLALVRARDHVIFPVGTGLDLKTEIIAQGTATRLGFFDAWVKIGAYFPLQSIAWYGRPDTNPAFAIPAHQLGWWFRLNNGHPELVVGSPDVSDGGAVPDRGLYTARSISPIPLGEWTHIRFRLTRSNDGLELSIPLLWVNGQPTTISLNSRGAGTGGTDWLVLSSVPSADASYILIVGAARDAHEIIGTTRIFTVTAAAADYPMEPQRESGLIHSLGGRLAGLVIAREPIGR